MGKLDWYGPQAKAWIGRAYKARLSRAAITVANHAKELVSQDGTAKPGKGQKRRLRSNANPSAPGEAPHVQTGRLRGSITWEVEGLTARVGTNIPYGRWLELGTRLMKARPWLRRAAAEKKAAVLAILATPIQGPT